MYSDDLLINAEKVFGCVESIADEVQELLAATIADSQACTDDCILLYLTRLYRDVLDYKFEIDAIMDTRLDEVDKLNQSRT